MRECVCGAVVACQLPLVRWLAAGFVYLACQPGKIDTGFQLILPGSWWQTCSTRLHIIS